MRWITKSQLRIDIARLQAQLEGMTLQLRQREEYITKLEHLLDHERDRIDAERNRADRASDALLQQNGIAPITELGVAKSEASNEAAQAEMQELRDRVGQFYAESLDDLESDAEISPEIKVILMGVQKDIN